MKDKFDDLISKGKDSDAARLFAKEYYDSGKMGHTRKLLIERLADKADEFERVNKAVKKQTSISRDLIEGRYYCPVCKKRSE